MMYRTHIIFALFFYLLFAKIFSLNFSLPFAIILCIGSILPDIDSANSFINNKFKVGKAVSSFAVHRGFWHSIFGCLIFFVIALAVIIFLKTSIVYALALSIGCFLHLAADSFNPSGIKWFWKRGHLHGSIRTSSLFEQVFFIVLVIGTVCLAIGCQNFEKITAFFAK